MIKRLIILSGIILILSRFPLSAADSETVLRIGNFSAASADTAFPSGWEPYTFKNISRHTDYNLVKDNDRLVVKAMSASSASGLIRKLNIDPKEYPILNWRWKVTNIIKNGDITSKAGDDCAARLYILFQYDPKKLKGFDKVKYMAARHIYGEYPPLCAIVYIWANKAKKGTVMPNPYSDKAVSITVESGENRLHEWVQETRNVYQDYQKLIGGQPPMISGVAIMTDTDNTGESAITFYGDILFMKSK